MVGFAKVSIKVEGILIDEIPLSQVFRNDYFAF